MIEAMFKFNGDIVLVKLAGNSVQFGTVSQGAQMASIENLKLSKLGVTKEFPDLADDPRWRDKAIKRFKEKIKSYPTEKQKMNYIIEDLKMHGYFLSKLNVPGFRSARK